MAQVYSQVIGSASVGQSDVYSVNDALTKNLTLKKFAEKFTKVRSGADYARIVTIADSTGVATGSNSGWSDQIVNMLNTSGLAPATSQARLGFNVADSRVVLNNSWSADNSIVSIGGATWKATTNTNSIAITPAVQTDKCRIWYVTKSGNGVFSLDYSGLGTITQDTNAASGVGYVDITASLGSWTYNVKWSSGGQVNIIGYEAWNSNIAMVRMITGALGGTTTSDWAEASQPWSWLNALAVIAPDLYICAPGINDCTSSMDMARYNTNLDAITAKLTPIADLYYATQLPANPNDTAGSHFDSVNKQDAYAQNTRDHATRKSLPLLDIYSAYESYTEGNARGYYGDAWVHQSVTGYARKAGLHLDFMLSGVGFGRGASKRAYSEEYNVDNGYYLRNNLVISRAGSGSMIVGVTNASDDAATNCTVVGDGAGALLTTAQNTTIVGVNAMSTGSLSGKINNTAVGYECLKACTGNNNTAIGLQAGLLVNSGSDNTIVGHKAGSTTLTTGARNILIANGNVVATTPAAGTNDFLNLGNLVTGDLANFNLSLLNGASSAGSFGGGVKVVFITNATTVPTTNPTGGGILYCEAGALKYRGSSGTITTLGLA